MQYVAIGWSSFTEQASCVGPFDSESDAYDWLESNRQHYPQMNWRIRSLIHPESLVWRGCSIGCSSHAHHISA